MKLLTLDLALSSSGGRVELLDGLDWRRRWWQDDKARIIEKTLAPAAKVIEAKAMDNMLKCWSEFIRVIRDGRVCL
ncbi:hypothetical protein [Bradyrhizobium sp. 191]|uniref:hypothetical protein n=1 Tax=Bradyrhizobium sp. 191 TaxID=2782659 RepID=UPI0020002747|nr:hypothetical protein [Bradyrhizobium sp. 191]UPJ68242.1 hypothetical protein IVB23_13250 [Bradyrhizobium sp. 191]